MSTTIKSDEEFDDINLSKIEKNGLSLIRTEGEIPQSEFWKELDISSRKGSRIVQKLDDNNLIQREETVYQGHNTYLLKPDYRAKDLDFSLLMAGNMLSPLIGDDEIDGHSDAFTKWIMNLVQEQNDYN